MKNWLCALIFCCLLLNINVTFASGLYKIGEMELNGNICVWTSNVKRNCTQEVMEQKMKQMNSCLEPLMMTKTEKCQDMDCINQTLKEVVEYCCARTGGETN